MRKAFFSSAPIALLLLPLFAAAIFHDSPSVPSLQDALSPAAVAKPVENEKVSRLHAQIAEAKQLLATQPLPGTNLVTVAAEDPATEKIHLLNVPKDVFLKEGAELTANSSLGEPLELRVVRPNYVNTAVEISDRQGRELEPLVVKYPIEKKGTLSEMAYYTSAHPALESPEVREAGQDYVRRMMDLAARRLADKGYSVNADIMDIAEHLCVVEHTDHKRFDKEEHKALFDEIYDLYALNERGSFGYSVSTAGAGGMIQMIPTTYQAIRASHPEAQLNPDFVAGMRDHANALEAMLLYIGDTWKQLSREEEIRHAMDAHEATEAELLAAGYNSNPMRLATYLKRGGAAWRALIPQETQMYLRIYAEVDQKAGFSSESAS